jgi:hypothetical protein
MDPVTLLAVGSALQVGSQVYSGISAKKQAEKQAGLLRERAGEVRARGLINAKAREDKGQQERGSIATGITSGGLSREDSIDSLNYSLANQYENIKNIIRESEWEARMTEIEADQINKAGKAQMIGSLLGAAGTAAKAGYQYSEAAPKDVTLDREYTGEGVDPFGIYGD